MFQDFENHQRLQFKHPIYRVTSGQGGEVLLIKGKDKAALVDCGMAYSHKGLTKNIKDELGDLDLAYILLTHSHYDHVGGLPYLREEFPRARVLGSAYCKNVLERDGARNTIKRLGQVAALSYGGNPEDIKTEGLWVDQVLNDDDIVDLDQLKIRALETPGHTACSMSFLIIPDNILIASESTGILINPKIIHTAILKSHKDSLLAGKRLKDLKASLIILPHYGLLPAEFNESYWAMFFESSEEKKNYILTLHKRGFKEKEILDKYIEKYWEDSREQEQPKEAFVMNAENIIKVIIKEYAPPCGNK